MLFATKGLKYITAGWTGFMAENFILSQNRSEIISEIGDDNFHYLYNTLSSLATASILYGFFRHGRNTGPLMNTIFPKYSATSNTAVAIRYSSRTLGLFILSQCIPKLQLPFMQIDKVSEASPRFKARCPMEFTKDTGITGVKRITRYPELWSLGLISISFAFSPLLNHVVFFGWPLIVTVFGGLHQDYRYRRGIGGYLSPTDYERSSFVPFAALISGRQNWADFWKESKGINAGIAVVASFAI